MNVFGKDLDKVEEPDLQQLIANSVLEGAHLEYKSAPPTSDSDKNKFLKTASGFANAGGGILIYGIEEQGGKPAAICSISVSVDQLKLQLQQLARTRIQPPLPYMAFHSVSTSSGDVLLVYVRRSWVRPHMCTQPHRFYIRGDGGNREMDREELRSAFLGADAHEEQLSRFRVDRSAMALSGQGPFPTPTGVPLYLVHVVSLDFLEGSTSTPADQLRRLVEHTIAGHWGFGQDLRLNFDGVVTSQSPLQQSEDSGGPLFGGYSQSFRRGAVEFVTGKPFEDAGPRSAFGKCIFSGTLEQETLRLVQASLTLLQQQACSAPVFVFLSLFGVRGYMMAPASGVFFRGSDLERRIDRDDVLCTSVMFETLEANVVETLRPALDQLWQASGYERSPNIDDGGQFRVR